MPPAIRRHGPLALALVACVLLAVSQFMDLYSIRINTVVQDLGSVGGHHAYAVLVVAIVAAIMAVGAFSGGSRPAAAALVALALVALAITLFKDLPVVDEEGVYGQNYEGAKAQAEAGIWVELIGALLLLGTGIGALLLRREPGPAPRARRPRPDVTAGDPT